MGNKMKCFTRQVMMEDPETMTEHELEREIVFTMHLITAEAENPTDGVDTVSHMIMLEEYGKELEKRKAIDLVVNTKLRRGLDAFANHIKNIGKA